MKVLPPKEAIILQIFAFEEAELSISTEMMSADMSEYLQGLYIFLSEKRAQMTGFLLTILMLSLMLEFTFTHIHPSTSQNLLVLFLTSLASAIAILDKWVFRELERNVTPALISKFFRLKVETAEAVRCAIRFKGAIEWIERDRVTK